MKQSFYLSIFAEYTEVNKSSSVGVGWTLCKIECTCLILLEKQKNSVTMFSSSEYCQKQTKNAPENFYF